MATLHSFCGTLVQGTCADGSGHVSGLVQGPDGQLYGTTQNEAARDCSGGTIFQIGPAGKFTTLYNFCIQTNCADGTQPQYGVIVGPDGNLYGTTSTGGAAGAGTFFTITPAGHLTTLYSFCTAANCSDGAFPLGIVLGSDGSLYGTTAAGANNYGTIFQITPAGVLTTLHSFVLTDGGGDGTALMQDTSGAFLRNVEPGRERRNGTHSSGWGYAWPRSWRRCRPQAWPEARSGSWGQI